MASKLIIVFKDSLMGSPSELKFKVLANNIEIDKSIIPKNTDTSINYNFENNGNLVKITSSTKKKSSITKSNSYEIKIFVLSSNGSEKNIGSAILLDQKKLTIVAISPWTKIPFNILNGEKYNGDYFDIEYEKRKSSSTPKEKEIRVARITVKDIPRKIIMAALRHRGDTKWSGGSVVTSTHPELKESVTFKSGTNKCNVFVNDVLTEANIKVAWIEHGKSKYIPYYKKLSPPTAGEWANTSLLLNNWLVEKKPLPGDVGAYAFGYSNASGHVGIIVTDGVTISAGWEKIELNDAGFRVKQNTATNNDHDFTVFRRYKGKSQ